MDFIALIIMKTLLYKSKNYCFLKGLMEVCIVWHDLHAGGQLLFIIHYEQSNRTPRCS